MKTGTLFLLGFVCAAVFTGCAKKERFGGHIEPTYFPVIKEDPAPDRKEKVTVKFIGIVTEIRPAKPSDKGIVIGSKFHSKHAIEVRVDRILQNESTLVTLDQKFIFLVESLPRTFGRHRVKMDGTEKERQYRFTIRGEIGNENKYEYVYMFGSQL